MVASLEPRRVLVVADAAAAPAFRELFSAGPLASWEAVAADSLAAATFILQHHPCGVVLVDESLYRREGAEAVAWLARQRSESAVVVLSENSAESAARAYSHGVNVWLPRQLALENPQTLAVALASAGRACQLQHERRRLEESLEQGRKQIDRLVSLLWRTLPLDADRRWFSQRHMLERLQEEIERARRYGNPLTVALGEVQAPAEAEADESDLVDRTAERIVGGKRRCDVAGQYGLRGFMLLMVNTPAEGGATCCRRLQRAIEEALGQGPHGPVRALFGLASLSADATPQSLLRRAEDRLDAARASAPARLALETASS